MNQTLLAWSILLVLVLGIVGCSESKEARYNRQAAKYNKCPECGSTFIYGQAGSGEKFIGCACGWKAED